MPVPCLQITQPALHVPPPSARNANLWVTLALGVHRGDLLQKLGLCFSVCPEDCVWSCNQTRKVSVKRKGGSEKADGMLSITEPRCLRHWWFYSLDCWACPARPGSGELGGSFLFSLWMFKYQSKFLKDGSELKGYLTPKGYLLTMYALDSFSKKGNF